MTIGISTVVQTGWTSGLGNGLLIQNFLRSCSNLSSSKFCFNKAKFVQRLLIMFSVKNSLIIFQINCQDRKKSTVVNLYWKCTSKYWSKSELIEIRSEKGMTIRISTVVQTGWTSGLGNGLLIQNFLRSCVQISARRNFLLTKQNLSSGYLSSFLSKIPSSFSK